MKRSKMIHRAAVVAFASAAFAFGLERASAVELSKTDKEYLDQSTEEVVGEASLSRIADKYAQSDEVKKFASEMVKGSEKMEKELHAYADKYGYILPGKDAQADARDAQLHAAEKTPAFDKTYLDEQIKDHQEMIKLWDSAADKVDSAELKKWFTDKSVDLKDQLDRAQAIRTKLGS